MRRLAAALLALTLALASPVWGQERPATLIADAVRITSDNEIVAEGNVEVLYSDVRMQARRVVYNRSADRVKIEGPITIVDGAQQVILADGAELDADLQNGILRGARLVLDQQLQLAAAEINRVSGRYTQLYKTVASSCQVCGSNEVPLWRIRATRVTHDQEARQLYFNNARLEVMGAPIFYVPRLRLPDPTLERATGFMIPEIRANNRLGTGLRIPYFIALGPHSDLRLTPYLSRDTRTLEARYRRAFRFGDLLIEGAASDDDLTSLNNRWFLFGTARFALPREYVLNLDVELVSDVAYLLDYDYSEKDRLDSAIEIERTQRDEFVRGRLIHFRTLRDSEIAIEDELPSVVSDIAYVRRFTDPYFQGQSTLRLEAFTLARDSSADMLGRDLARLSARFDWRKSTVFGPGVVLTGLGQFNADFYRIDQDSTFSRAVSQFTPFAGAELRWPLTRTESGGALQTLEPVVQLIWSEDSGADVPNEDSAFTEFDEGNLFSLNRFPGSDAYERGLRMNVGATWTRTMRDGRYVGLTFGRIFRADDLEQFAGGSGLDGSASDWLLASQVKWRALSLTNRALFDDGFDFTKNELRLDWRDDKMTFATTYFWADPVAPLNPDGSIGAETSRTSEITIDAAYRLDRNWTGRADWRYDFVDESTARAGLGLVYSNECVVIDLSLSRRFTSSTSVLPSTDFGISVRLTGFGTGTDGRALRRSCGT